MILHSPMAFGVLPGTNCMQLEHFCSPFGLSWYLSDVRMAALVAASAHRGAARIGITAIAAPPILRKLRRGFLISFIGMSPVKVCMKFWGQRALTGKTLIRMLLGSLVRAIA